MLLAIERSATPGTAALLRDDGLPLCSVEETGAGRGDAFSIVSNLLQTTSVDVRDITRFAVGIGPGSFSGIRSAIALLNGMAIPIGAEVAGVGSAPATALAYRKTTNDTAALAVVGDARRGNIWIASFPECETNANIIHDPTSAVRLVPRGELAAAVEHNATVLTPDWDRIGELLISLFGATRARHAVPTAQAVGELALQHKTTAPIPLYLQPAVSPPSP